MSKRAISITNQEISIIMWMVGLIMFGVVIKMIYSLYAQVNLPPPYGNPGLAAQFSLMMFILVVGIMFSLIAVVMPNYLISKYDLDLFVNRISNPDWIGWLRFTKSKGFRPHIVKKGPLGVTHGMANSVKADCVNNGDYIVTLPNGNQAIIKSDLLNHNVNLEQNIGWELVKKHFGCIGFKAWERAANDDELMFKFDEEENVDKQEKQEDS